MLNIVMLCCVLTSMGPIAQRERVSDSATWRGRNGQRLQSLVAVHTPTGPLPLMLFQTAAVIADGVTTRQMVSRGFVELDPITRPLIGRQPTYGRMIPLGAAEVGLSYLLARKYPKLRWLQVSLIVTHTTCAVHNSRL